MNSTYTSWNGEEHPWPPPENWYRAADGKWWHPAHGPDDPPHEGETIQLPVEAASNGAPNRQRSRPAVDPDDDSLGALPVWDTADRRNSATDPPPWEAVGAPGNGSANGDLATSPAEVRPNQKAGPAASGGGRPQFDSARYVDDGNGGTERERRSRRSWLTAVAIGAAVLILAIGAQIVFGRSTTGDGASSESTSTAATGDEVDDADEVDDDLGTGQDGDAPSAESAGTDQRATDDAGEDPAVAAAPSETDPEVAVRIAEFRGELGDRGLATDELTDSQITTFTSTYCVYAAGAEDRAAFDELRRIAVTTSSSNLTPEQLNLTITTAVMVFCPDESARLGITYETSP